MLIIQVEWFDVYDYSKEKCTVFNKGTWSSNTELSFSDTADVASHICDDGLQRISVEALDQELLVKRSPLSKWISKVLN